jgi:hypothetical protein
VAILTWSRERPRLLLAADAANGCDKPQAPSSNRRRRFPGVVRHLTIYRRDAETPSFRKGIRLRVLGLLCARTGEEGETGCVLRGRFRKLRRSAEEAEGAEHGSRFSLRLSVSAVNGLVGLRAKASLDVCSGQNLTKGATFWDYRRDAETPSSEGYPSLRPRLAPRSNRGRRETRRVRGSLFHQPGRSAEEAEGAEFEMWFLSAS